MAAIDEVRNIFFDGNNNIISIRDIENRINELQNLFMIYECGIKEIKTKLEILDDEFKVSKKRNPIEYMKSRVKSPESIVTKLIKKGVDLDPESMKENLSDIAGIRVICSFIDDIYEIADMLKKQNDITLISEKDYINEPKPSGYRSLHMVLEVPVFFSDKIESVRVEVQVRTIAMDFWASLEHKLRYKNCCDVKDVISEELKKCADIIADTDIRMQEIQKAVEKL